jgi:hypothetical protein
MKKRREKIVCAYNTHVSMWTSHHSDLGVNEFVLIRLFNNTYVLGIPSFLSFFFFIFSLLTIKFKDNYKKKLNFIVEILKSSNHQTKPMFHEE